VAVNHSQQVIGRNLFFQAEIIKQRLCPSLLTHHRRCSSLQFPVAQQGVVTANKIYSAQTFSTDSGVYETKETVWAFGGAEERGVASLEGGADVA
jgi:hypothetical protein